MIAKSVLAGVINNRQTIRSNYPKRHWSIGRYPNKNDPKRRSRSRQRYDDYVDTEPDGMYCNFTPNQRDEYYERHRSKKRGHGRWMNVAIVAEAREVMAMIIREDI